MDGTPEVVYRCSFRLQSLRIVKQDKKPILLVYSSHLEVPTVKRRIIFFGPLTLEDEMRTWYRNVGKQTSSEGGAVAQKNGKAKCMTSQAEYWQENFRVGKDLRGYCRGQITIRFVLGFACSGEGHGEPTFTVIWEGVGVGGGDR